MCLCPMCAPHTPRSRQGKAWQFKDFPFKGAAKGDLVETFSNIFGAFFHYRDDAVSAGGGEGGGGVVC